MKLRWRIHGTHCLTVDTGGGRALPRIEWRGEALRRVSAGWNRDPERHTIEHWLDGALPENGTRQAFERRALALFAERDIEIGKGTVYDHVWANADWEFPGAITFDHEEDRSERHEPDGYVALDEKETGERLRDAAAEAELARTLRPRREQPSKSALSGAQGKIGVHIDEKGQFGLPRGRSLSTRIIKVENRPDE